MSNDLLKGLSPRKVALITKSGVLDDPKKVRDLEGIVPEERPKVLVQHVVFGVDWDEAIAAAPKIPATAAPLPQTASSPDAAENDSAAGTNVPVLEFWDVAKLKPNRTNKTHFSDSLVDDSLRILVTDLKANGQLDPIYIFPDGTIYRGERRWRALQIAGITTALVRVNQSVSDQQVQRRAIDDFASTRRGTVKERVAVYRAALTELKAPDQISNDISDDEIEKLAATMAHLGSAMTAKRALAVFERASASVIASVEAGEISISKAYEELPKRPKKKSKDAEEHRSEEDASSAVPITSKVCANPFVPDDDETPETPTPVPPQTPLRPPRKAYRAPQDDVQPATLETSSAPDMKSENEPEPSPEPANKQAINGEVLEDESSSANMPPEERATEGLEAIIEHLQFLRGRDDEDSVWEVREQCFKRIDDFVGPRADEDRELPITIADLTKRFTAHIEEALGLGVDHAEAEFKRVFNAAYVPIRRAKKTAA